MTSTDEKGRCELRPIAYIRTPYKDNFGVPRQSGMVRHTASRVEFTPEFRDGAALRGLEEFSHVWLIWQFSEHVEQGWSPTVRPPRLGGNERRGVFATRSPFRPNPLGLSCVELLEVGRDAKGPYLLVDGADMLDGSPIYDVKPYLPFSDSHPEASAGYTAGKLDHRLQVEISDELLAQVPAEDQPALRQLLALDPRPGYQHDPERVYGLDFNRVRLRFSVAEEKTLTVLSVEPLDGPLPVAEK